VQNFKLTTLLILSIATLAACTPKPATDPIAAQGTPDSYPEGDIYNMTYKICRTPICGRTSQIVTWGRPTEVGIAYYARGFPERSTGNQRIEKMADRRDITLVIKSKGTLPALEQPLETERFIPVEHFSSLGFTPITKSARLKVEGTVQIVSITKLTRPDQESPRITAVKELKAKINDKDMIEAGSIDGFIGLTKKDPDIRPQQVEKITWQEGQPEQIISLKPW